MKVKTLSVKAQEIQYVTMATPEDASSVSVTIDYVSMSVTFWTPTGFAKLMKAYLVFIYTDMAQLLSSSQFLITLTKIRFSLVCRSAFAS